MTSKESPRENRVRGGLVDLSMNRIRFTCETSTCRFRQLDQTILGTEVASQSIQHQCDRSGYENVNFRGPFFSIIACSPYTCGVCWGWFRCPSAAHLRDSRGAQWRFCTQPRSMDENVANSNNCSPHLLNFGPRSAPSHLCPCRQHSPKSPMLGLRDRGCVAFGLCPGSGV